MKKYYFESVCQINMNSNIGLKKKVKLSKAIHYKISHLDKTNGLVIVKWAGNREVMACETQMCSQSHM